MKPKQTLRHFLAAIGCATIAISSASAQTDGTWNQTATGTHDWSVAGNWLDGDVAGGTDATASFTVNPSGVQTVNLDTSVTLGSLILNRNQNLTLVGPEALTFDVTSGMPVVSTSSGRTLWIDTVIAGDDGLEVTGPGILRLSATATNTLTGGIHLNSGNLGANNATTTTAALNNNHITVSGNSTFVPAGGLTTNGGIHLNAGSLFSTGTNNNSYTVNGAVTGSGTIRLFQVGLGGNTINLNSTANTFTGSVEFTLGNINQSSNLNVNSFVDTGTYGEGNIRFNAIGNNVGNTHTFALASGAVADLTLNNRRFEIVASTGLSSYFVSNNSSQAFTVNSDILVTATGNRRFGLGGNGSGTSTFNGLIANGTLTNLGLLKTGTGTWSVTGNNTYNAVTEIRQGALSVSSIGSVGGGPSNLGSPDSVANGSIILGNAGNTGTLLYTGAAASTDRSIQINSLNNTNTGGAIIENNGTGALTFTAPTFNEQYALTSTVTRALTLSGSNDGEIQGVIQNNSATGTVRVAIAGTGTWTLSGDNTYTGTTTVAAGSTLIINGNSSTATGAVTVEEDAVLGGSGTVGGATTINGALNPGNSPGVLSFSTTLTLGSASTTTMEIGGSNRGVDFDGVTVGGALNYGGGLVLDLVALFGPGNYTFNLFESGSESGDFASVALAGQYGDVAFTNNSGVWTASTNNGDEAWTFSQSTGDLNLVVIPEPTTALLGGLGLLALLRRRR